MVGSASSGSSGPRPEHLVADVPHQVAALLLVERDVVLDEQLLDQEPSSSANWSGSRRCRRSRSTRSSSVWWIRFFTSW